MAAYRHRSLSIINREKGGRAMNKHQVVLLYSGGLDSTLLLHMAKTLELDPIALLIFYGQKHVRELESAVRNCNKLQVPYRKMQIDLNSVNSGLTGANVVGMYQGVSPWHVPGRNTIFVGLALSLAESIGAGKIWYGANMSDFYNDFADCKQEWIGRMGMVTKVAGSYPIELEAPLLGMTKTTIEAMAKSLSISLEDVHSGYHE
jgi:7-cyano-7-deazaguanine synthase